MVVTAQGNLGWEYSGGGGDDVGSGLLRRMVVSVVQWAVSR